MTGRNRGEINESTGTIIAQKLFDLGVPKAVIRVGEKGALWATREGRE